MRWNLAVAALATFWGFVSVIVASVTLGPLPLTLYRTGLAALALPVALAVLGRLDLLRVRTLRVPLVLSGAALAAHWWCYFETIKLAGAAVANFTVYTAPILLSVLAPMVLPESRSRVALAALVPGGGGLVLLGKVTAQATGLLSYIEPVSAALLTWAILGQRFGWQVAVGGALVVLAGIAIVLWEPADVVTLEAPCV